MEKKRLGKGLSALLGEYLPVEGAAVAGVQTARVSEIVPNPLQPRREFSSEQLGELETSIRENGLLQPLVVRPATDASPEGARWELVAGERRWRAIRRLGWTEVPVLIRDIDDRTLLVLAIVENVQRADLSPLEEAAGYRRLIDEFGYTQREVAESVGRERPTVANLLRLLNLPASVQRLVAGGGLSMGHARAILGLGDERKMGEVARTAAKQGLSVRAVEERVRRLNGAWDVRKKAANGARGDAHLKQLETELQRALGTAARIRVRKGQSGTVEIPFYNSEDFERVMDLLIGVEAGGRL